MTTYLLNHNSPSSLLRRPAGLSDEQWDCLVITTANNAINNHTSFMYELIQYIYNNLNTISHLAKDLGIDTNTTFQQWIINANLEHTAMRFFRHYCPENVRNALHHSGLPIANLVFNHIGFLWKSEVSFKYITENDIFKNSFGINLNSDINVVAYCYTDIATIEIFFDDRTIVYYQNDGTQPFGQAMYKLKQIIKANKKHIR